MVTRWGFLSGMAAAASCAAAPAWADGLTDGTFQARVLALLAVRHPEWHAAAAGDTRTIMIGPVRASLDNIYLRVAGLPEAAGDDEIVSLLAAGVAATKDISKPAPGYAAVVKNLRPQLIPADYLRAVPDILNRPFFAGLLVAYAIDDGPAYQILSKPEFLKWGVTQARLEADAVANLEALSAGLPVQVSAEPSGGAWFALSTGDGYDAARLLLPGFMARVRAAYGVATVYAGIPDRDVLVTWTADFGKRQEFAAQVASDSQSQPHALTGMIFVSQATGVRPARAGELGI